MARRIAAIIAVLSTTLLLLVPAGASAQEGATSSVAAEKTYVVVMAANPVVAYDGGVAGIPATRPRDGAKADQRDANVVAYREHLAASHDNALRGAGANTNRKIHDYSFSVNGFAARLNADQAAALAKQPGVVMVQEDTMRQVTTDNTPDFLGLTAEGGAWDQGITGEDVVVGVIDTGIWPEHPSFLDDGTYGPAPAGFTGTACAFGNTSYNHNDAPFTCNNKLLSARAFNKAFVEFLGSPRGFTLGSYLSARDEDGHGTHTASTSAGNSDVAAEILGADLGTISGIAPRARVAMYKACWSSIAGDGCFGSDLAAAVDQAVADGVDVINYSIGGGASLIGAEDLAFLFAADAGVFVATSNGNSGPGAGTGGGPASVPWITAVGASTQDRSFEGTVTLGDGSVFTGVTLTGGTEELSIVDSVDAGSELCIPGELDPEVVAGNIVLCMRGAIARVAKSQAVEIAGGAGMVLYNAFDPDSQVTDNHYVPSLHTSNADGVVIKAYIAANEAPTATLSGGMKVDSQGSVMAGFSSRGPNAATGAADLIQPDVTAPGVNILAGNTPTALSGAPGQLFQAISGTSMSSPHVAGTFALLKQAHPDWSPAAAKSALMTTSRQDVTKEDAVTQADPFDMGAGHIVPNTALNPGLVYDAGFLDYLGFLCEADSSVFSDPAATCAALVGLGIPTDGSDLNVPSIGIAELVGTQTVTRTVTDVSGARARYRVNVVAPTGVTAVASPRVINVPANGSVSYTVTFTATDSAPLGQWLFGSVTLKGLRNGKTVFSPVAVKAALFDTVDSVDGTGTDGAASFDVTFGYTGDYTAAAHGLEAEVLTSDVVNQDADQTFDPSDVGAGATAHAFDLTGAAFARFALPPSSVADPGLTDLDLYVYDPNGVQVGSSGLGGTNEVVDILLPEAGVYTVYVHGWAVDTDPEPYDLSSWIISLTPGGSLSLDSAPASATIGTVGSVDISWAGLDAGVNYLGAVSHTGTSGLLGVTLVSVDTN